MTAPLRVIGPAYDPAECLAVLDDLRAEIEAGTVAGFAAVSVDRDGGARAWRANGGPITNVQIVGAVAMLQADILRGTAF